MICEFCFCELKTRRNLERHQKTDKCKKLKEKLRIENEINFKIENEVNNRIIKYEEIKNINLIEINYKNEKIKQLEIKIAELIEKTDDLNTELREKDLDLTYFRAKLELTEEGRNELKQWKEKFVDDFKDKLIYKNMLKR